jgi:hypothetical protein
MIFRSTCFAMLIALGGPAMADGSCGVGCHATGSGSCVRDGWQEASPVLNECPATSRPTPPCGQFHRWSRQGRTCVVR